MKVRQPFHHKIFIIYALFHILFTFFGSLYFLKIVKEEKIESISDNNKLFLHMMNDSFEFKIKNISEKIISNSLAVKTNEILGYSQFEMIDNSIVNKIKSNHLTKSVDNHLAIEVKKSNSQYSYFYFTKLKNKNFLFFVHKYNSTQIKQITTFVSIQPSYLFQINEINLKGNFTVLNNNAIPLFNINYNDGSLSKNGIMNSISSEIGKLTFSTFSPTDNKSLGISKITKNILWISGFSLFAIYVLAFLISISIVRSVRTLIKIMHSVASGNLHINLNYKFKNEFGILFSNFKKMINAVREERDTLEKLTIELESELQEKSGLLEINSQKDQLTGLNNRKYFDKRIYEEIERSNRTQAVIGLMFIDIDHFKNFNQKYGQAEGDKLLTEFAKKINSVVRATDIFCRLGGDQFAIIAVNANLEGLLIYAKKVSTSIYETKFAYGENQPLGHVTCSIGISLYPQLSYNSDSFLKSASEALYFAKQNGKNRWQIAEKHVAPESEIIMNDKPKKAS